MLLICFVGGACVSQSQADLPFHPYLVLPPLPSHLFVSPLHQASASYTEPVASLPFRNIVMLRQRAVCAFVCSSEPAGVWTLSPGPFTPT